MDTSWGSFGWTWLSTLDLKTQELLLSSNSRCSPTFHMSVSVFSTMNSIKNQETNRPSGAHHGHCLRTPTTEHRPGIPGFSSSHHSLSSHCHWVDIHWICLFFILLYCDNNNDNNTTNYFACATLFILQMPQSLIKKNKQMKRERTEMVEKVLLKQT